MEEGKDIRIFSKKDSYITLASIVLVCIIFALQLFLFYRLYESNLDLLQRELNLAADEIYKEDLNRRLAILSQGKDPNLQYFGSQKPDAVTDTTKVITLDATKSVNTKSRVTMMNAALEEYASRREPIRLQALDSVAAKSFKKRGIHNSFYSEVIDIENNKVLQTSLTPDEHPVQTLSSNDIPVNAAQTKVLRITLINPLTSFYLQMATMLVLSMLLCFVCIYSFHVHRRSLAKQRQINRLKSDLFSDISHEFKRPLQTFSMVMSYFDGNKTIEDNEKRRRFLKIGKSEIKKMDTQLDMIIATTKDEEGFLQMNPASFDLTETVDSAVGHYLDTVLKMLDIEVINAMKDDNNIFADKDHISKVISNLIENSIKYSKEPTEIVINLSRDNNNVYISVKDNGIGISKEDRLRIFDRYTRVENAEVKAKGYGIGLNYCKRIVEKHRGEITVVSELGKGSEFVVRLPQKINRQLTEFF